MSGRRYEAMSVLRRVDRSRLAQVVVLLRMVWLASWKHVAIVAEERWGVGRWSGRAGKPEEW